LIFNNKIEHIKENSNIVQKIIPTKSILGASMCGQFGRLKRTGSLLQALLQVQALSCLTGEYSTHHQRSALRC
jgi:hypothetical protein